MFTVPPSDYCSGRDTPQVGWEIVAVNNVAVRTSQDFMDATGKAQSY